MLWSFISLGPEFLWKYVIYIKKTFTIPSKYLDIYSSSKSLHAWNGRGRLRTGLFRTIITFLTFWE